MGDLIGKPPLNDLTVKDVADFLKVKYYGTNFSIKTATSLDELRNRGLVFSKSKLENEVLNRARQVCFIVRELPDYKGEHAFIIVDNPRLAFAKVLMEFFLEKKEPSIGVNTVIHPTAEISPTVTIGNNCTIGRDVEIGDYTEIRNNATIAENVKIGKHCLIRSNCVIGEEGFGFEYDMDEKPIRIPHLGGVKIGDCVEIGNFVSIARGTLKDTIISSYVKIDNLVHIAHNCIIGENTLIIACAEVSGSCIVGRNCWLGVGCTTMQKIRIGDNSVIGIGAVVIKDVPPNAIVAGNPAKIIRYKEREKR